MFSHVTTRTWSSANPGRNVSVLRQLKSVNKCVFCGKVSNGHGPAGTFVQSVKMRTWRRQRASFRPHEQPWSPHYFLIFSSTINKVNQNLWVNISLTKSYTLIQWESLNKAWLFLQARRRKRVMFSVWGLVEDVCRAADEEITGLWEQQPGSHYRGTFTPLTVSHAASWRRLLLCGAADNYIYQLMRRSDSFSVSVHSAPTHVKHMKTLPKSTFLEGDFWAPCAACSEVRD